MGAPLEPSPIESADVAEGTVAVSEDAPETAKKQILLLEDDVDLREIIKDYLTENGYTVSLAEDGADAAHRALDTDFEVIICDMVMPIMSGEDSYRAISKLSPNLHDRFIFITGHSNDLGILKFISGINAKMLGKPFELNALMKTIKLLEPESGAGEETKAARIAAARALIPSVQAAPAKKRKRQAPAAPRRRVEIPASAGKPLVVATAPAVTRAVQPQKSKAREEESDEGEFSFKNHLTLLMGVCLVLSIGYHHWVSKLHERIEVAEENLRTAESEWTDLSGQLGEAEKKRPEIERLLALPGNFTQDLQTSGWTPLLQNLVTSTGANITFQEIQARGIPTDLTGCKLAITGFSTGQKPRAQADRFRQALLDGLQAQRPGSVTVAFEKLEDAPEDASGYSLPRANFTITAVIGHEAP